jgi:hypothetical protein
MTWIFTPDRRCIPLRAFECGIEVLEDFAVVTAAPDAQINCDCGAPVRIVRSGVLMAFRGTLWADGLFLHHARCRDCGPVPFVYCSEAPLMPDDGHEGACAPKI